METRERSGDAQIPKGIIFIKVNTYKEIFLNWKKKQLDSLRSVTCKPVAHVQFFPLESGWA